MHHRAHDLPPGGSASGGSASSKRSASRGVYLQGYASGGVCLQEVSIWEGLADPPTPTGTRKAGGTHPTGMLSCSRYFLFLILKYKSFYLSENGKVTQKFFKFISSD